MNTTDWKNVQRRLNELGFDAGPVDGIPGARTSAALIAYKESVGLRARAYVGPITMSYLGLTMMAKTKFKVPWMNEMAKYLGKHERTHFSTISKWLRSDGKALGDPRKLPWCGDAVDTALNLTLPNEPRSARLKENPYLARNWMEFGKASGPRFGAVVVFWRGRRNGMSGHVGFAVAFDESRNRIKVRGGNQSNTVSDAWLDADRLLGYRAPTTYGKLPLLPGMSSAGAAVSRNEA